MKFEIGDRVARLSDFELIYIIDITGDLYHCDDNQTYTEDDLTFDDDSGDREKEWGELW